MPANVTGHGLSGQTTFSQRLFIHPIACLQHTTKGLSASALLDNNPFGMSLQVKKKHHIHACACLQIDTPAMISFKDHKLKEAGAALTSHSGSAEHPLKAASYAAASAGILVLLV